MTQSAEIDLRLCLGSSRFLVQIIVLYFSLEILLKLEGFYGTWSIAQDQPARVSGNNKKHSVSVSLASPVHFHGGFVSFLF